MWRKRKADSAVSQLLISRMKSWILKLYPLHSRRSSPGKGSVTPRHPRTNPDPRDQSIASLLIRCESVYWEMPFNRLQSTSTKGKYSMWEWMVQWTNRALLVSFLVWRYLFLISLETEEEVKNCHCLMKAWPTVCCGDTMRPSNRNLLHKTYFGDGKIH